MNNSRYNISHFIRNGDSLDSRFIAMLNNHPNKVNVVVPQICHYRSDVLARMFLGDPSLEWIFFVMNSITSREAFAAGNTLKSITMADLEKLYTKWKHTHGENS